MSNRIKIVNIINALNIGGSEKLLVDTVNFLEEAEYDISVISLTPKIEATSIFNVIKFNKAVKVFYLQLSFFNDYTLRGYYKLLFAKKEKFAAIPEIESILEEIKPDIVHFHTTPGELIIKNFLPHKFKYLFTDHSLRISQHGLSKLKTVLLAQVFRKLYNGYKVIAVSKAIQESLIRNKIVSKTNITVISNSIDTIFFSLGLPLKQQGIFNVVYVSRIEPTKGHGELIKAWASLEKIENKQLYIVGPDGLNGKLEALAEQMGCKHTITFTGALKEPKDILKIASVGVFPSHKEGLPLALLEKMSMSIPVIVSDIEELTGIIEHEKNGLVFKSGNHIDLARQISRLYENPELMVKLGNSARETVKKNYDSKTNLMKLDTFYKEIVKQDN